MKKITITREWAEIEGRMLQYTPIHGKDERHEVNAEICAGKVRRLGVDIAEDAWDGGHLYGLVLDRDDFDGADCARMLRIARQWADGEISSAELKAHGWCEVSAPWYADWLAQNNIRPCA